MGYQSIFNHPSTIHDNDDPLCLDRSHEDDPDGATWLEFYEAAITMLDAGHDQPAFFLARHCIELSLKRLMEKPPRIHGLEQLLGALPVDHPLREPRTSIDRDMRAFALDLHRVDPSGTEGRYGRTRQEVPCLSASCCVNRSQLREYLDQFVRYVEDRVDNEVTVPA